VQQPDHLLADPVQIGAQARQNLRSRTLTLTDQAKQQVLGADVVVAQLECLAARQFQHLLGTRCERDVPGYGLLAPADDLFNLLAHRLQADAQRLQRLGRDAPALTDQPKQQVLGAEVSMVEQPGFFVG
jgi:hypothetical protein